MENFTKLYIFSTFKLILYARYVVFNKKTKKVLKKRIILNDSLGATLVKLQKKSFTKYQFFSINPIFYFKFFVISNS